MSKVLENRVVAYLDILGFKELWKENHGLAIDILKGIRSQNSEDNKSTNVDVVSFSDNIIISFPVSEGCTDDVFRRSLCSLIMKIATFYLFNLQHGVVFRGAIAFGEVFYDAKIIAGSPMNEAVDDEKYIALYPRVVVSRSLCDKIETLSINERNILVNECGVKVDFDGILYIDYFLALEHLDEAPGVYLMARNNIKKQLDKHKESFRILPKWRWIANYFNSSIERRKFKYSDQLIEKL